MTDKILQKISPDFFRQHVHMYELVQQYSEMDMWQYLYAIGYGLIPKTKLCKQLLYYL